MAIKKSSKKVVTLSFEPDLPELVTEDFLDFYPEQAPPIVLVAWEDAKVVGGGGAWVHNEDFDYEPHIVWQSGFLVKDVPEGIMICDAWHKDLIGPPTQIPRGMIRSFTILKS